MKEDYNWPHDADIKAIKLQTQFVLPVPDGAETIIRAGSCIMWDLKFGLSAFSKRDWGHFS